MYIRLRRCVKNLFFKIIKKKEIIGLQQIPLELSKICSLNQNGCGVVTHSGSG